ncbi:MAG TPA: FecR domain-containing protein [Sphingobacteriaceae bacterium]
MNKQDIQKLFVKYKAGLCTEEEKAFLESWYLQYEDKELQYLSQNDRNNDLQEIRESLLYNHKRGRSVPLFLKVAAVAAILLLVSVEAWILLKKESSSSQIVKNEIRDDIQPGTNKAVLRLADGSIIDLNGINKGRIANETGIVITKVDDGKLLYTIAGNNISTSQTLSFNTIETPRGGQYQVELPDGTKVWLNAVSSLRFPTGFPDDERVVQLTGEAYFEVARDKKPFRVMSNNQKVEVLGTRFNINSYLDNQVVKTTLLEGSVRVSNLTSKSSNLLIPGQQASVSAHGTKISTVDLDESIAWKNGYFIFENEKITSIMKKISRWYDVEVVYEGKITDNDFNGSVSRFDNISKVLDVLELTRSVHFKLQGRRITVMP